MFSFSNFFVWNILFFKFNYNICFLSSSEYKCLDTLYNLLKFLYLHVFTFCLHAKHHMFWHIVMSCILIFSIVFFVYMWCGYKVRAILIDFSSSFIFAYNIVLTTSIDRAWVSSYRLGLYHLIFFSTKVFHSDSTILLGCSSNVIYFYCSFISSSVCFFNVETYMLILLLFFTRNFIIYMYLLL